MGARAMRIRVRLCDTLPLHYESLIYLPMEFFKPHDDQAKQNHCDQSLERLNERGGIGADEAIAILSGEPYKPIKPNEAMHTLAALFNNWVIAEPFRRKQR
ncbi:hypothetical protein LCGC14_3007460 [marine sediment metagenome]|uniref:Uncharacterized protein n=1 Tax=marine sediment metagenome TaxID=412755 RepID=A0A0F8XLY9_9ZZZZ